jgi:hypothetical protein
VTFAPQRRCAAIERARRGCIVAGVAPLALFLSTSLGGCGAKGARSPAPPGPVWTYDVLATDGGAVLTVDARIYDASEETTLVVDEAVAPYVQAVSLEQGDAWTELPPQDDSSRRARGCDRVCHVRYRFQLGDAASDIEDVQVAGHVSSLLVTEPGSFLLHPTHAPTKSRYRFTVVTPPGTSFVTGVFPASGGAYEADALDIDEAPFSAFGELRQTQLSYGGATIDLAIGPGLTLDDAAITRWTNDAARAISGYYGRFPIQRTLVMVLPTNGDEVGFGQASGGGGAAILARVGAQAGPAAIVDDWVLPHEMVHLAMPYMRRRYHWFEEGLATYVEPIARVRAGQTSVDEIWKPFLRQMHHGLPEPGDEGLDNTHTWGRTYWGGALFCLLADIDIRVQTKGAKSLDDALRGVVAAGGNLSIQWDLDRALDEGDRATGTHVLRDLHTKMGPAPMPVDLPALFGRLGVALGPSHQDPVIYDESAELAWVRRAISTGSK